HPAHPRLLHLNPKQEPLARALGPHACSETSECAPSSCSSTTSLRTTCDWTVFRGRGAKSSRGLEAALHGQPTDRVRNPHVRPNGRLDLEPCLGTSNGATKTCSGVPQKQTSAESQVRVNRRLTTPFSPTSRRHPIPSSFSW